MHSNIKYKGVKRRRDRNGRMCFVVEFMYEGRVYSFGHYSDPKECAKAHDLFVIRKGIDRNTNFLKPLANV